MLKRLYQIYWGDPCLKELQSTVHELGHRFWQAFVITAQRHQRELLGFAGTGAFFRNQIDVIVEADVWWTVKVFTRYTVTFWVSCIRLADRDFVGLQTFKKYLMMQSTTWSRPTHHLLEHFIYCMTAKGGPIPTVCGGVASCHQGLPSVGGLFSIPPFRLRFSLLLLKTSYLFYLSSSPVWGHNITKAPSMTNALTEFALPINLLPSPVPFHKAITVTVVFWSSRSTT